MIPPANIMAGLHRACESNINKLYVYYEYELANVHNRMLTPNFLHKKMAGHCYGLAKFLLGVIKHASDSLNYKLIYKLLEAEDFNLEDKDEPFSDYYRSYMDKDTYDVYINIKNETKSVGPLTKNSWGIKMEPNAVYTMLIYNPKITEIQSTLHAFIKAEQVENLPKGYPLPKGVKSFFDYGRLHNFDHYRLGKQQVKHFLMPDHSYYRENEASVTYHYTQMAYNSEIPTETRYILIVNGGEMDELHVNSKCTAAKMYVPLSATDVKAIKEEKKSSDSIIIEVEDEEQQADLDMAKLVSRTKADVTVKYADEVNKDDELLFLGEKIHFSFPKVPVIWHLFVFPQVKAEMLKRNPETPIKDVYVECFKRQATTKELVESILQSSPKTEHYKLTDYTQADYGRHLKRLTQNQITALSELSATLQEVKTHQEVADILKEAILSLTAQIQIANTLAGTTHRSLNHHLNYTLKYTDQKMKITSYNLRFSYPKEAEKTLFKLPGFKEAIQYLKDNKSENHNCRNHLSNECKCNFSKKYDHPLCRGTADYMSYNAWADAVTENDNLIDIGSKYHRLIPVMEDSGVTGKHFYLMRPNLFMYDEIYNNAHGDVFVGPPAPFETELLYTKVEKTIEEYAHTPTYTPPATRFGQPQGYAVLVEEYEPEELEDLIAPRWNPKLFNPWKINKKKVMVDVLTAHKYGALQTDKHPMADSIAKNNFYHLIRNEAGVVGPTTRFNGAILAADCYYYTGVQQFVKNNLCSQVGRKAYVSAMTAPCYPGRYYCYANEGYCDVYKVFETGTKNFYYEMKFYPHGNPQGAYQNPVLAWDVRNPRSMDEPHTYNGQDYTIHYELKAHSAIGDELVCFYYVLTASARKTTVINTFNVNDLPTGQYNEQMGAAMQHYLSTSSEKIFYENGNRQKPRHEVASQLMLMSYACANSTERAMDGREAWEAEVTSLHKLRNWKQTKSDKNAIVAENINTYQNTGLTAAQDNDGVHVRKTGLLGKFSNFVSKTKNVISHKIEQAKYALHLTNTPIKELPQQHVPINNLQQAYGYINYGGTPAGESMSEANQLTLSDKQKELLPEKHTLETAGLEKIDFYLPSRDEVTKHIDETNKAFVLKQGYSDFYVETGAEFFKRKKWSAIVPARNHDSDYEEFIKTAITNYDEARQCWSNAAKAVLEHPAEVERRERQAQAFVSAGIEYDTQLNLGPYYFSSTVENLQFAFFGRQLGHLHNPHPETLKEFTEFAAKEIDERIRNWLPDILTWDEFIQSVEPCKRQAYQRGYDEFLETGRVDPTMTFFQKSGEMHYTRDGKPRCIANPSDTSKATGAWINRCYLNKIREIFPEMMVGYNSEEMAYKFTTEVLTLKDHRLIVWDGSQHDSHQHAALIEAVDSYLFKKTLPRLLTDIGIPPTLHKTIYDSIVSTESRYKLEVRLGKFRRQIQAGRIKGTVFSGHATRTTLGNSLRVILYARFIMHKAQIPKTAYRLYVAGDDVVLALTKKYITAFKTEFEKVYINGDEKDFTTKTRKTHGLGQVSKDFKICGNLGDFLSKNYVRANDGVLFNRKITRSIQSGNFTNKISKHYSIGNHNQNITDQLSSWALEHPGMLGYIEYRYHVLTHTPISQKQLNKLNATTAMKWKEERMKLASSTNTHVLDYMEQAVIHRLLRGEVLDLIDANPGNIPMFLPLLKGI